MKKRLKRLTMHSETMSQPNNIRVARVAFGVLWNLTLIFSMSLIITIVFIGAIGAGYFAALVKDEPLRTKEEMREQIFSYEETSEMYFANNVYIGKLRTDLDRQKTTLDAISPHVIDAVIATEDELFYEHNGIVPKAVLRGLLQDVTNASTQTGGSTLTQQLIKNQILTNEVSYERKAKELLLAMRLEKFMKKDEILEAYLNVIPYGRNSSGRNIAGIETAAQGIFGVSAKDLSLPQAAYIAGIPQAPFTYTPFTPKGELKSPELLEKGVNRMKTVLYRMKTVGTINEKQYKQALEYNVIKDFKKPEVIATSKYPWLTAELETRTKEIIAKLLAEKDGIEPARLDEEENIKEKYMILADRDVRSGGYRIYSTIDKGLYDAMEKAAKNYQYYGHTFTTTQKDPTTGQEIQVKMPVEVGSVLIENQTGRILSFVAGRDFKIEEFNHATQSIRQIGSTMKPLLVYAPAIEYGMIGAGSPVVDVKFKVGSYAPVNYLENQELGLVPARDALASSQNLAAIRLYSNIMDKKPGQFLKKMKFNTIPDTDYANLTTAIGGTSYGTTVERNTNAYATFANGGKFIESYMIEKIEDLDGNVIYQHQISPVQVYAPETAYIITDMLRDVLTTPSGTGTKAKSMLKFSGDFAAKTGTTNNYNDVWFVGYNKNVSLGLWLGYDKERSLYQYNGQYFQPSTRVNMLWANLMNAAYDIQPKLVGTKETFKQPKGVVSASFCGISGLAPSSACSAAGFIRSDLFYAKAYLPKKVDDSLISASGVRINGKIYRALNNTPSAFITSGGVGLNGDFVNRMLGKLGGSASSLLPRNSSLSSSVIAAGYFPADDAAPSAVTAQLNGNTLSWTKSASNDVVGYYVYRTDTNSAIATVSESSSYSTIVSNGSYAVVAVDITGKQSAQSNVVSSMTNSNNNRPNNTEKPSNTEKPGNTEKPNNTEKPSNTEKPENIKPPVNNNQTNTENVTNTANE